MASYLILGGCVIAGVALLAWHLWPVAHGWQADGSWRDEHGPHSDYSGE